MWQRKLSPLYIQTNPFICFQIKHADLVLLCLETSGVPERRYVPILDFFAFIPLHVLLSLKSNGSGAHQVRRSADTLRLDLGPLLPLNIEDIEFAAVLLVKRV